MHKSTSSHVWPLIVGLAAFFTIAFALVFFAPAVAHAQPPAEIPVTVPAVADISATAPAATLTWQQAAIAIVTPLIIAGVKLLVPKIPKLWLPIIAPVVGCLLDLVAHFATGSALNPTVALALGAAGVGLREVVDQLKLAGGAVATEPPARIS